MAKIEILDSQIFHKRFYPKINQFKYRGFYIGFSLQAKNQLKSFLFSLNKPNIYSFYDQDHGSADKDCNSWIKNILSQNNISNICDIYLVTQPRIFGYVFNPVSFWLCFDYKKDLIAVLAEVNNTFSQRHSYLIFNHDFLPIKSDQWFSSKKVFHVSPFFEVDGHYKFRFVISDQKKDFYINYYQKDRLNLSTHLKCSSKKFCDKTLGHYLFIIPFASFKTIFLIHFQALKLFFKNVKFFTLDSRPNNQVTIATNKNYDQNVKK
jgi:DUF1365 family protein